MSMLDAWLDALRRNGYACFERVAAHAQHRDARMCEERDGERNWYVVESWPAR